MTFTIVPFKSLNLNTMYGELFELCFGDDFSEITPIVANFSFVFGGEEDNEVRGMNRYVDK